MIEASEKPRSSRALLDYTPIPAAAARLAAKLLQLNRLDQYCNEMDQTDSDSKFFSVLLARTGASIECEPADLDRVPAHGPAVIVCNHPFGMIEGPMLGSLLERIRPDFKFLANSLLASLLRLRRYVIPVNPFGGERAIRANWRTLRESIHWVRNGGLLVVFPAGEVSSLDLQQRQIADPVWNEAVVRIIQAGRAAAIPLFFHGLNSPAFHIAGLVHPALRTALLPREFFNKKGRSIRISIGRPVPSARLEPLPACEALNYLRSRTQLLDERASRKVSALPQAKPKALPSPIAPPMDPERMAAEIASLPDSQRLHAGPALSVFLARARQIPVLLHEIGRQREIGFRKVGEGTGKPLDLDRFDAHYQHLVLWNSDRQELAGSYRLAATDEILPRYGTQGLYTSTLFRYRNGFLESLGPALELGRSFIRSEYQKNYQSLLLLWKGIGKVVAQRPRYRFLFGPLSISNRYLPASRVLMAEFLASRHRYEGLAGTVSPIHRFQPARNWMCDLRRVHKQSGAGHFILMTPKKKARKAVKAKVRDIIARGGATPAAEVVKRINATLAGWVTYFRVGNSSRAFSEVRDYVEMKVRTLLTRRKRRRKSGVGWRRWSNEYLYDVLELYWGWKIQPLPGVGKGT